MLTITEIKEAVSKTAPMYPIHQVHLFGSYAEGTAKQNSDVDVLVEFGKRPITLLDFCGFQQDLSDLLKVNVDILESPISKTASEYMTINKVVHLYGRDK
ncbi:MAG: nucleotidyltransferase domain-containing protein [Oscillospiraceae bacterium]|nr:nucleotidyltransferase domain-containing protein [Oscillospiraceae bacterium]